MKSLGQKIMQLDGLAGRHDTTAWEHDFIVSILEKTDTGRNTTALTEKQADAVERLWKKHFA